MMEKLKLIINLNYTLFMFFLLLQYYLIQLVFIQL